MSDSPEDDPTIEAETRLFRRITPHHWKREPDGIRLTSAAFQGSSDGSGVSISIEDKMIELSIEPADLLVGEPSQTMLVALIAGEARNHGKRIIRSPNESDPAHGNMIGPDTRGVRNALRRAALREADDWVVGPTDVGLD